MNRGELFIGLFFFFLSSCSHSLNEDRANELVRLRYKQMNADPASGKWFLEQVSVGAIQKGAGDTFWVSCRVVGFHSDPVIIEGAIPYTQPFSDSLQFKAYPSGKVWVAKSWKEISN